MFVSVKHCGGGDDCRVRFSFIDKLWGGFFLKSV